MDFCRFIYKCETCGPYIRHFAYCVLRVTFFATRFLSSSVWNIDIVQKAHVTDNICKTIFNYVGNDLTRCQIEYAIDCTYLVKAWVLYILSTRKREPLNSINFAHSFLIYHQMYKRVFLCKLCCVNKCTQNMLQSETGTALGSRAVTNRTGLSVTSSH